MKIVIKTNKIYPNLFTICIGKYTFETSCEYCEKTDIITILFFFLCTKHANNPDDFRAEMNKNVR